jgi:hypothetical protein
MAHEICDDGGIMLDGSIWYNHYLFLANWPTSIPKY